MADNISAIPQQPQLGRLAQFLRFLETQNAPEFLPKQLDVMGLMAKLALPQASTVENLSYGNYPFTMPPAGTGAAIPQVKTGRKPEVADLVGMLGGVPGVGAVSDVATKLSNEAADAIVRAITRNPEATATGVIRETSMPFMQAAAPRTPGLLETPAKSELGFYSALEQATMPLQNKGTGAQFLAQIEKTAGVKPEEVKWTGLDEFLKSRQNVTKQDVQDYLAANRVNLQERRLAGDGGQSPVFAEYSPDTQKFHVFSNDLRLQGLYDTAEEADAFVKQYNASIPYGPSKFSKYTLPGGENYREILLTLPSKQNVPMREQFSMYDESGELISQGMWPPSRRTQEVIAENPNFRIERTMVPDRSKAPEGTFVSSHFNQPNILAHMRVNDRVVDGKKTLFIEEIQSDWHQAGRKKGYQQNLSQDDVKNLLANEGYDVNYNGVNWVVSSKTGGAVPNKLAGGESNSQFAGNLNQVAAMVLGRRDLMPYSGSGVGAVPDAPFKTTWHELTLKRAIQEASEKGYDQIAFTTGKTQAERYDLSKQIDRVAITKTGGVWSVNAWKDGSKVITKDASTDSDLANLVGKELADKAVKQGGGEYAGLDLQVGGEGMKGFYDQILPKTLDKLGKKFDAKVTKTTMPGDYTRDAHGIPSMRPEQIEVWAMDITPKMRESVLTKGQPLFAATPAIPAAGLLGDENE